MQMEKKYKYLIARKQSVLLKISYKSGLALKKLLGVKADIVFRCNTATIADGLK